MNEEIQGLKSEVEGLRTRLDTHTHDGVDSAEIQSAAASPASSRDAPLSIPNTAPNADTTVAFYTDDPDYLYTWENNNSYLYALGGPMHYQRIATSTVWPTMDNIWGAAKIGPYVYVLMEDEGTTPDTWRIYRFDVDAIAGGGLLMTFDSNGLQQTNENIRMACDGSNIYINYLAGNSGTQYTIGKYVPNGLELTYQGTVTCGSSNLGFANTLAATSDGSIYTNDLVKRNISKFTPGGTLVYTDAEGTLRSSHEGLCVINDRLYCYNFNSNQFERIHHT